jgi:DNA-directed RNA polymerase
MDTTMHSLVNVTQDTLGSLGSPSVLPEVANELSATQTSIPLHIELDKASSKLATRNERAFRNTGFGATTGGLQLTRNYLADLVPLVEAKLATKGRADALDTQLERLLLGLDPAVIAMCILQHGLHSVAQEETLRDTNIAIGEALARECWAAKLTINDPKLAAKIAKAVKTKHANVAKRDYAAKQAAARAGYELKEWPRTHRVSAGMWGVNLLIEGLPDIFELVDGRNNEKELTITPKALGLAEDAVSQAVLANPVYQPRTTPLSPWTSFMAPIAEDSRVTSDVSLLRTFHKDVIAAAKHAIKTGQMAPALAGINALQAVPYCINTWIMDIVQATYDGGYSVDGLPMRDDLAVPAKLTDEAFEGLSVEERIVRRKEVGAIRRVNRSLIGSRVLLKEDMEIARRMAVEDAFYVPMNCDWRGRAYGLSHFNFAREDRVRAMFLFANGEPIGEDGIYWLKIHVANCGDFGKVSKKPMADRIAWVDRNIATIGRIAANPMPDPEFIGPRLEQMWMQADAPFLFLAACRELISALIVGPSYVTHLPVSFDGTCSGLQHLAAMTRAPEGAHVNLTDNASPSDVYQLVADAVKAMIEDDLLRTVEEGTEKEIEAADKARRYARQCLDYGINRSLVKRNVMTFAYSSKVYGMSCQHLEDTMEPLKLKVLKGELEEHPFGDDEGYGASKYLGRHVYAAIERIVKLPAEAMAFLQSAARALAHEGKPLTWTTPAGIPWINRYHEATTERVSLWLNDNGVKTPIKMKVAVGEEKEISKEKASSGVAPNFVHACDAAHLLLTVGAAAAEGITDIATVHDSFGCLASRATRFNAIIRETFLRMYEEHDVLAELLASAQAQLTEANHHKLPGLPERGTLDLKEILRATYAFA